MFAFIVCTINYHFCWYFLFKRIAYENCVWRTKCCFNESIKFSDFAFPSESKKFRLHKTVFFSILFHSKLDRPHMQQKAVPIFFLLTIRHTVNGTKNGLIISKSFQSPISRCDQIEAMCHMSIYNIDDFTIYASLSFSAHHFFVFV